MRARPPRRFLAMLAIMALLLAGCGADDDPGDLDTAGDAVEDGTTEDDAATDDAATDDDAPTDDDAQAGALEGCSPDQLDTHEPGQLTVATGDPVFPPWMMDDDPEGGEGFENGLVYELADRLGFDQDDVVWVRTGFDEAIAPGAKDYDFNIQQFSVTEDRAEVVDFSIVYYQPEKAVIALPDSPVAEATSFEELREANWGATLGTTDLDYLEQVLEIDGVAVFDDQAGVFQALQGGQIDATVAAVPTALFATAVQVEEAEIVATLPPDPQDNGHGLLFEQDSPLVDCIDQGLQALIDDGVVDELSSRYLTGDGEIPEITG
jgi:polar amino acid transport system substrate-binding protein